MVNEVPTPQQMADSGLSGDTLSEAIWSIVKDMPNDERQRYLNTPVTATVWHGTRRREPIEQLKREGFCSYTPEQAQRWMAEAKQRLCEKKKAKAGGLICKSLERAQQRVTSFINAPYRGQFSVTGVEEAACGEPDKLDSGWADRNPEFMNDLLMYQAPVQINNQILEEMFGKPIKATLRLHLTARNLLGPHDIHTKQRCFAPEEIVDIEPCPQKTQSAYKRAYWPYVKRTERGWQR